MARYRPTREKMEELEARIRQGETVASIVRSENLRYTSFQRWRRACGFPPLPARADSGPDSPAWKGGRCIEKRTGYVLVTAPMNGRVNRYRYEHILIAEQMTGRRLTSEEVVHHIDGDKTNNQPANLYVCSNSAHKKMHGRLGHMAEEMVRAGVIVFKDGVYSFATPLSS